MSTFNAHVITPNGEVKVIRGVTIFKGYLAQNLSNNRYRPFFMKPVIEELGITIDNDMYDMTPLFTTPNIQPAILKMGKNILTDGSFYLVEDLEEVKAREVLEKKEINFESAYDWETGITYYILKTRLPKDIFKTLCQKGGLSYIKEDELEELQFNGWAIAHFQEEQMIKTITEIGWTTNLKIEATSPAESIEVKCPEPVIEENSRERDERHQKEFKNMIPKDYSNLNDWKLSDKAQFVINREFGNYLFNGNYVAGLFDSNIKMNWEKITEKGNFKLYKKAAFGVIAYAIYTVYSYSSSDGVAIYINQEVFDALEKEENYQSVLNKTKDWCKKHILKLVEKGDEDGANYFLKQEGFSWLKSGVEGEFLKEFISTEDFNELKKQYIANVEHNHYRANLTSQEIEEIQAIDKISMIHISFPYSIRSEFKDLINTDKYNAAKITLYNEAVRLTNFSDSDKFDFLVSKIGTDKQRKCLSLRNRKQKFDGDAKLLLLSMIELDSVEIINKAENKTRVKELNLIKGTNIQGDSIILFEYCAGYPCGEDSWEDYVLFDNESSAIQAYNNDDMK